MVQPAADRSLSPDRARLACQGEEGGLESILGILGMAEQPPADAQHHRPMAPQQQLERRRVALRYEALQQLLIAEARGRSPGQVAQRTDRVLQTLVIHELHPGPCRSSFIRACDDAIFSIFFCSSRSRSLRPVQFCRAATVRERSAPLPDGRGS